MAPAAVTPGNPHPQNLGLRQPSGLRLVDDVAHSLEDAILAGKMRPGERLIETRVCRELGVSRTTLREALLWLQRRGLVRNEPRRGTFVTRLSREDSLDLCRTRALLEAFALSAGYHRLGDHQFQRMQTIVDEMATCRIPDDVPEIIQLDHSFHELVVAGADSPGVLELWSGLNGKMSALILSSIEHHHAQTGDIARFHQVMLDALKTGSIDVARNALVAHYLGDGDVDGRSLADIARTIESMSMTTGTRNHTAGVAES